MCQLAVSELPVDIKKHVEVNPIEVLREGPSYTIDTVEAVAQNYEGDTIVLIVGTDAYEKIDQWHRAEELKTMVEFVVIDRPEFPGQHNTSVDAIAVSATDIRAHKSDAVPAAVAAYIKEHNLYASK
jgi:nicotinate-nucleotide adenylyltransferase